MYVFQLFAKGTNDIAYLITLHGYDIIGEDIYFVPVRRHCGAPLAVAHHLLGSRKLSRRKTVVQMMEWKLNWKSTCSWCWYLTRPNIGINGRALRCLFDSNPGVAHGLGELFLGSSR